MELNLAELEQKKRTADFLEDVRVPSMVFVEDDWLKLYAFPEDFLSTDLILAELKLRKIVDDYYENVGVDLNIVELEPRKRSHLLECAPGFDYIVYFSLLAGAALNVLPSRRSLSAGGHVSLLFQGLPSPAMFQTSFVLALSAACGALLVRRDPAVRALYSCFAALSMAAAAILLLFSFSSSLAKL